MNRQKHDPLLACPCAYANPSTSCCIRSDEAGQRKPASTVRARLRSSDNQSSRAPSSKADRRHAPSFRRRASHRPCLPPPAQKRRPTPRPACRRAHAIQRPRKPPRLPATAGANRPCPAPDSRCCCRGGWATGFILPGHGGCSGEPD
jgi:hypothetical protein